MSTTDSFVPNNYDQSEELQTHPGEKDINSMCLQKN